MNARTQLAIEPSDISALFGSAFFDEKKTPAPPNKVTLSEYLGEAQRLIQSFAADGMQLTSHRNAMNEHFVIGHFTDIKDLAYSRLLDSVSPSLFGEQVEVMGMALSINQSAADMRRFYPRPFDPEPAKLFERVFDAALALAERITPVGIRMRCTRYETFTTISILMGQFQDHAIAMILIPHAAYKTKD